MRITELAKKTNSNPDQIRYFERKGFIRSRTKIIKVRKVRDYPEQEAQKVLLIMRYTSQGFRLETAYEKAMIDFQQPRLV